MEAGGRLGALEFLVRLLFPGRLATEMNVMSFHSIERRVTTNRLHFQLHVNQGVLQSSFHYVCSYGQKVLKVVQLDLTPSFD